jgi:alpha-glucosidase (family GH31 glycosyl hydrolase)
MVGLQDDGKYRHYDVHNLYGLTESKATQLAVRNATGKRSFVLTRSTFIGNGRYAGHWLGDNAANTVDMHRSIIGLIESSIFGIPYVGADICGFIGTTDEELCTRWMQLGAFYPFSRNHNINDAPDQDPASFSQFSIDSSKRALKIRYTIIPYYYTLFYKAHVYGNQVIKVFSKNFQKIKIFEQLIDSF